MATCGEASVGVSGADSANLPMRIPIISAARRRDRITLKVRSEEVRPRNSQPPIKCLVEEEEEEEGDDDETPHLDDLRKNIHLFFFCKHAVYKHARLSFFEK